MSYCLKIYDFKAPSRIFMQINTFYSMLIYLFRLESVMISSFVDSFSVTMLV